MVLGSIRICYLPSNADRLQRQKVGCMRGKCNHGFKQTDNKSMGPMFQREILWQKLGNRYSGFFPQNFNTNPSIHFQHSLKHFNWLCYDFNRKAKLYQFWCNFNLCIFW